MGKKEPTETERALESALAKLATEKKRAFVREYPIDLNLTKAAERAGYSKKSARQEGSRLLSDAAIQGAINLAIAARAERTEITADTVIRELHKLVFSDLRKVFDEKGGLKDTADWPDEIASAIASVEVDELFEGFGQDRTHIGYTKKIRLWDKNSAIDKLGRHLKMWGSDSVNINLLQQLPDAELNERISAFLKKPTNESPQPKAKVGAPGTPPGAGPPKKA